MMRSRTLGVSIAATPQAVYAFIAEPLNLPKWAAGLGSSIGKIDGRWVVETPNGPATVEFAPRNTLGVLDHTVTLGSGAKIHMPIRVIPNGRGSELAITLFQQPGMSDAQFQEDASLVQKDLRRVKELLEAKKQGDEHGT
jgi:hypothetical protein